MRKPKDIGKDRAKEIFADGFDAQRSGLSMGANPWPVLSREAPHWALGWIEAQETLRVARDGRVI